MANGFVKTLRIYHKRAKENPRSEIGRFLILR